MGQRVVLIRTDSAVLHADYLVYSIYSEEVKEFIDLVSQGSTVPHLNMSDIPNLPLWTPSVAKQVEIVARLNRVTAKLELLVRGVTAQLALLAAYRQALITAAVTGDLDIALFDGEQAIEEAAH